MCRRRSRRWLTGDRWLAVCRRRRGGLCLTGRQSVWRICILNRNRLWSDRRRKRRCEQSGGASACNAGTNNSRVGRWRFRCGGRLRLRCRGLRWRGESLGLPTWIGNYNGIGGVIDDDSIVDVVVDDIVRRWRNVFWRVDPDRYWNINRNRQNICIHRRWRRSQIHEVDRSRRQEKHRRRRRRLKSEIRIIENQYRPFDINHLFRRRRRNIIADDFESRRRFESGRQICKPTPCIVSVGAAGITTQIRPVSGRRIDAPTAPPRYSFAAGCNNCLHPSCHRIVRISTQEILIVLQIVAIQSCEIGLPRVKITDGLRSDRRSLFRRYLRRRRIRCPLKKVKRRLQLRCVPRHLGTLGCVIDAKANPVEQVLRRKATLAHHLRKCLGVRRIGSGLVLRDRSWCSVKSDQRSRVRLDKGQATRKWGPRLGKRAGSSPIKNDDAHFDAESSKRLGVVRKA